MEKYPVNTKLKENDSNDSKATLEIIKIELRNAVYWVKDGDGDIEWQNKETLDIYFTIIEQPQWKPEKSGDRYYFLNDHGCNNTSKWLNDEIDTFRLKTNNVFKTEKEAQAKLNSIMES